MMKVISVLSLTLVCSILAVLLLPISVYAEDSDNPPPIAITVVVPREDNPIPTPQPNSHHIYPVQVWESREDGRRHIIRVYELGAHENPAHIPREPFERDGFRFELAEIVRREIPAHSIREHEEIVTLSTQTNDLATVIALLSSTLDYLTDDGYFGVLALDISSIRIESQGTTSSNFTASQTREFPHLSSPDTSLVPRTITNGGRTYSLADVQWRTQSSSAVDHREVANTHTAVATYTRTGTRTSTIGYTTTAVYRGQISRIAVGRTEFTASFIGIPIVTPVVNMQPTPEAAENQIQETETEAEKPEVIATPGPTVIENVVVEQVQVGGIVIEMETAVPAPPPNEDIKADEEITPEDEPSSVSFDNILIALLFIGGLVLAYFIGKKGKAMLGLMRRASCLLLLCILIFGVSQAAYAAELPRYEFGVRNNESAAHFNGQTRQTTNEVGISEQYREITMHFNPLNDHQNVMHFAPGRNNMAVRASPVAHIQSGNAHNYSYGATIGVLTVERLGRTVNVIAGATMEAMDFGGGHFSFTGLNSGNTGIIGHNRGSAGFFSFVRNLQEGDILTLEAGGITRSYSVSMLYIVADNDFSPLMEFGDHRLTLVTCVEYQRNQRRIAVALALE